MGAIPNRIEAISQAQRGREMSEVSEIQAAIDKYLSGSVRDLAAVRLLKRLKALLSSHAVITQKTADLAEVSIMLGAGHGDESVEIRKELTRLSTHKGK